MVLRQDFYERKKSQVNTHYMELLKDKLKSELKSMQVNDLHIRHCIHKDTSIRLFDIQSVVYPLNNTHTQHIGGLWGLLKS